MSSNHDYEELSLTSTAGLQAVFHNVQQLYQRGLSTEAHKLIPSAAPEGTSFHTAYRRVRAHLESLIEVVEKGQSVSIEAAGQLQRVYDSFVAAEAALATYTPPLSPATNNEAGEIPLIKPTSSSSSPAAPRVPTPVSSKPASESAPLPKRTSAHLPVTEVNTRVEQPKKKKRRRKKSRHKTGEQPTTVAPHGGKESFVVDARALLQRIATTPHVDANTVAVAKSLVEEVEMANRHIGILSAQDSIKHRNERLMHHETAALTAIAELELLAQHAQFTDDTAPVAKVETETASTIPITTTTVVHKDRHDKTSDISFIPTTVTTKSVRPVSRAIPKQLVSLHRPDVIHESFSLTNAYLTAPAYRNHIEAHYSDASAFERLLDASITTLESATIDGIERWLGDTPASAFDFIKDMTVSEFTTFASAGYNAVTDALRAENIKYETFLVWRDLYDQMVDSISPSDTMTYGELFARFMIEEDIASLADT